MTDINTIQQEISSLINEIRKKEGLSSLKFNPVLTRLAKRKNQNMIDENYFSHTEKDNTSIWEHLNTRLDRIIKTGNTNYSAKPNRALTNALYLEFHNRDATDNEFKRFNDMTIKDTANIIAGEEIIKKRND